MLRLALLRSLRPRPSTSTLPHLRVRPSLCSATRAFSGSSNRPAQPQRVQKGERDELEELESAPVVLAVAKRMRARAALQAQVTENMNTPEDKERMKRLAEGEPLRAAWDEWTHTLQLLHETLPLLNDPDPDMRALAAHERSELLEKLAEMEAATFPALLVPPSRTAGMGAMVEVKAGVGGAEAMLFAEDLTRMYARLSGAGSAEEGVRWTTAVVGSNDAEGGGVKEALVEVRGRGAYDVLRWESGVHRVQRVPATEASGRVHTSTAAVLVLPLEDEGAAGKDEEALYKMDDVRIEVMRARGAGGQHVNKTESAVRLTHVPTGITVSMQDERSQHQNRRRAFQVLQARLMDRKLTQDALDKRTVRRSLVKSADRSEKIRTYNYAQDRVTDHRLGLSLMNLTSVMEGDGLMEFLDAMGKRYREELLIEACEEED